MILVKLYKTTEEINQETGEWTSNILGEWCEWEKQFKDMNEFMEFVSNEYTFDVKDLMECNGNDLQIGTTDTEYNEETKKHEEYGINWQFLFYTIKPYDVRNYVENVKGMKFGTFDVSVFAKKSRKLLNTYGLVYAAGSSLVKANENAIKYIRKQYYKGKKGYTFKAKKVEEW